MALEPENIPVFAKVYREIAKARKDVELGHTTRAEIIRELEGMEKGKKRTLVMYVASFDVPGSSLTLEDTAIFSDILRSIGRIDYLDLVIHSPGGDGNAAEEMIDMCHRYCRKEFRVIVPFWAKSAATLIALCSNKIIMGETSQLGPIDPQILVVNMGMPQFVSALSFINSAKELTEKVQDATKQGFDPLPFLQQLAELNPAFIDHCKRLKNFTIDFGVKWMPKRMLKNKRNKKQKARAIIENFLSSHSRFHHGRMIKGEEILKTKELKDLNIEYKQQPDDFWKLLLELFIRAYVYLTQPEEGNATCKLFETKDIMNIQKVPLRVPL